MREKLSYTMARVWYVIRKIASKYTAQNIQHKNAIQKHIAQPTVKPNAY